MISAFGRKEVENFSFTPSLVGNYQENIVIENVLDSYQDQNVAVKANVRKQPNFAVQPALLDFGVIERSAPISAASSASTSVKALVFVLTNTSKSERVFAVEVAPRSADGGEAFEVSISQDESDAGTALSKEQEEEAEGMLQKLKIARRKGKPDKIQKYESRLTELGVEFPPAPVSASNGGGAESDVEPDGSEGKTGGETADKEGPGSPGSAVPAGAETQDEADVDEVGPQACVSTLAITLSASQKTKISVQLIRRPDVSGSEGDFTAQIKVYEKKNTDETFVVNVSAAQGTTEVKDDAGAVQSGAKSDSTSTSGEFTVDQNVGELGLILQMLFISLSCDIVSISPSNVPSRPLPSASARPFSYPLPRRSISLSNPTSPPSPLAPIQVPLVSFSTTATRGKYRETPTLKPTP